MLKAAVAVMVETEATAGAEVKAGRPLTLQ